jgi:signal transduction histidine kinase
MLRLSTTSRTVPVRIAVALGSSIGALVLSLLLREYIGSVLFVFFFAALAVTAFYSGFWGALFVVLFAVFSVNYFLMIPGSGFHFDSANLITVASFSSVALFVSLIAEQMRMAMKENAALALELEEINIELEIALNESIEARNKAEQSNRAKAEFLAVMSHELRTPLNAIMGYTDLIQGGLAGSVTETQRNHLARVRASSFHLLDLIQDVLTFARIEAGREALRLTDVEAGSLTRDVVAYVQAAAEQKELNLKTEVLTLPVVIRSDPAKLRQILLNLLSNAVKFTDRGEVGIRLDRDGEGVRFEVWDTGPGVAADDRERIFEPFTQADQSMTRNKDGAGLGLAVSRRLAHMLNGTLELDGAEAGIGSRFVLRLPQHAQYPL